MKKWCNVFLLFVLFVLIIPSVSGEVFAQDRKFVSVRLINGDTKTPFSDIGIQIWAFDTEAQGSEAFQIIEANAGGEITTAYEVMPPDDAGYFSYTLPVNGAFVIKVDGLPAKLEYVKGRDEFTVSINGGNLLKEATISVDSDKILPMEEEAQIVGDTLVAKYTFNVPKGAVTGNNARLILQPYFIEVGTNDTIARLSPYIYDGSEYHMTQERRMDYNVDNDPLTKFVKKDTLVPNGFLVPWRDSIWLPSPINQYIVKGKITIEDYNILTYVQDSMNLASSRQRRPMQFLDYEMESFKLDPQEYYEEPRPKKMETPGSMSLRFLVNQAAIDSKDLEGMAKLEELHTRLLNIVNDETCKLLAFSIESVSSPDGPYAKNVDLSKRRLDYIKNYLTSGISRKALEYASTGYKSTVASWSAVADSLAKDSLLTQAEDVRRIVEKYKDRDRQWQEIRKFGYYKELISPILEKMRTVTYTYKHQEFRPMKPAEIMDNYLNNEEYRSGAKHFEKYEYWELFRMLEEQGADKDELFNLYKRACEETKQDLGKSWIYAANKYAVACMEKGIVDTTILAPHIDTGKKRVDFKLRRMSGNGYDIVNPAGVVANQLRMFLLNYNFSRASIMAQILPNNDEFRTLKAITMCRGGQYKGGKTLEDKRKRQEYFEIAKESSPINRVVMLLAMNDVNYDRMAEKALVHLSDDDALTWYFKAVISSRKLKGTSPDFMEPIIFEEALKTCFDKDKKYVAIARNDGDIYEQELKAFFQNYPEYDKF